MKIKRVSVIIVIVGIALFYLTYGCPFRFFMGISCPGCGMTRSLNSLMTLDFHSAFYFHPMVYIMPVFAVLLFVFRKQNKKTAIVFSVMCLCLGIVYAYRMFFNVAPDIVYFHPEEGILYQIVRSVFYVS